MLQAAINIVSLMRRRRCGKLHSGSSHLLLTGPARHRSIASYITTIVICAYHTSIRRPVRDVPVGILPCRLVYEQTRIVWLPDGEKNLKIRLFVLTKSTNVTDRETDGHTGMNRDGGAYSLPTAYDRLLVTCSTSTSRDHKPDEARRWRAKRRN